MKRYLILFISLILTTFHIQASDEKPFVVGELKGQ
nr:hypothetical protein [Chlamydiota bacterium]